MSEAEAVYPSATQVLVQVDAGWVNIADRIVSSIDGDGGIRSISPAIRTASIGTCSFVLNNADKYFTVGDPAALPGWRKGVHIKVVVTYDGQSRPRWKGKVRDLDPDAGEFGPRHVAVTCTDWIDDATQTYIPVIARGLNKKIGEAANDLLDTLNNPPANRDFDTGVDTFPTTADAINPKDKVYQELVRLVLSEYGFLYLIRDREDGETLKIEARNSRDSRTTLKRVPKGSSQSDYIAVSPDRDNGLLAGNGKVLLLSQAQDVRLDNLTYDMDIATGENVINGVRFSCYPRRVDETEQILATLRSRVFLAAGGGTEKIHLSYIDPTGGGRTVTGFDFGNSSGTMTQNEDGTGSNYTANLRVSGTYGANGVDFNLYNVGGSDGWVVYQDARGKGIYLWEPITIELSDSDSIEEYGLSEIAVDQKYQHYVDVTQPLAEVVLNQRLEPKTLPETGYYLANYNDLLMQTFMNAEVGDLLYAVENQNNIDNFYFLHNWEFSIKQGGVIHFKLGFAEALNLENSYWLLETEGYSELEETTVVGL